MSRACFVASLLFLCLSAYAQHDSAAYVLVLGVAQDGGYPHIACRRECCQSAWQQDSLRRNVVSLAVLSPAEKKWWLVEATPDLPRQLQLFSQLTQGQYNYLPDGIFITHAHIGHYTGLMFLGREALGARNMPVYVLPGMQAFLEKNGPWSQLVSLQNIQLKPLVIDSFSYCSNDIKVKPFKVNHRDEFSETCGFNIQALERHYLFIPDIDKWAKWDKNIVDMVRQTDIAFLDATFYTMDELPNRDIREIPHPLVSETIRLFEQEPGTEKQKIRFIHFNHSNRLMWDATARAQLLQSGFQVAIQGEKY